MVCALSPRGSSPKDKVKDKNKMGGLKTISCVVFKNKVASVAASRPIAGFKASFDMLTSVPSEF